MVEGAAAYASVQIAVSRHPSDLGQDSLVLVLGSLAGHMLAARIAVAARSGRLALAGHTRMRVVHTTAGRTGHSVAVADLAAGSLGLEAAVSSFRTAVAEALAAGQGMVKRLVEVYHQLRCHPHRAHMPVRRISDLSFHECDWLHALVAAPHHIPLLAGRP